MLEDRARLRNRLDRVLKQLVRPAIHGDRVELDLGPFELVTLKLTPLG